MSSRISCLQCDKSYSSQSNLNKHVKVAHLQIKDNKCDYCDITFSYIGNKLRHIKQVHNKLKK